MPNYENDPVRSQPYIDSPVGRAWQIDHSAVLKKHGVAVEDDAVICRWLVEASWAHPYWHSYEIICVHLRPMPDNQPTKIYLEGATHEIWVYALDPAIHRQALLDGDVLCSWLEPKNFAAQFIEPSDIKAIERVEQTVRGIVNGNINPDTDARSQWYGLYGDNMLKSIYRE